MEEDRQAASDQVTDRARPRRFFRWFAATTGRIWHRDAAWAKVGVLITAIALPIGAIGLTIAAWTYFGNGPVAANTPAPVATGVAPTPASGLHGARDQQCGLTFPTTVPTVDDFDTCMLVKGADGEQRQDAATYPFGLMRVLIEYMNTGTFRQDNVTLRVSLPSGFTLVPGTTDVMNSTNPEGIRISDGIPGVGVNVGNYSPGASAYVIFTVQAAAPSEFECGENRGVLTLHTTIAGNTKAKGSALAVLRTCAH